MSKVLLEIKDLVSGYGDGIILRGVSLTVNEGDIVSIIGPNGHGKTTLLKAISGLLKVAEGEVFLDGKQLTNKKTEQIVESGIANIPQGDMIFSEMTILDNLLMGAHLPSARVNSAENLKKVFKIFPRLEERQDQTASTLSGGERRMLGIGRGLMIGGRILMIDEPSLGLSPLVTDQIYEVIRSLKQDGQTILLVEENASRTIGLADHVYLLDHGEFVWDGKSEELNENQDILETYFGG